MYEYEIIFAHENDNAVDSSVRHGSGSMNVTVDHPIETQEDLKEVARTIGLTKGFTAVGITKTTLLGETEDEA